jgi:hypothetical protein
MFVMWCAARAVPTCSGFTISHIGGIVRACLSGAPVRCARNLIY